MNLPNLMKWTVTVAWGVFALHTGATQATIGPEYRVGGFVLGCQAYMFHRFTAFEAIERTTAAGTTDSAPALVDGYWALRPQYPILFSVEILPMVKV